MSTACLEIDCLDTLEKQNWMRAEKLRCGTVLLDAFLTRNLAASYLNVPESKLLLVWAAKTSRAGIPIHVNWAHQNRTTFEGPTI